MPHSYPARVVIATIVASVFAMMLVMMRAEAAIAQSETQLLLTGMHSEGGPSFLRTDDGAQYMLYHSSDNANGTLHIYEQRISLKHGRTVGEPKRLTFTKYRCSAARYLRDGTILFLHDRGGDENFQIGFLSVCLQYCSYNLWRSLYFYMQKQQQELIFTTLYTFF